MEEKSTELIDGSFKIIFGALGSIFTGLLFFKLMIFNFHHPAFEFITGGIYGAVFFSLLPKFDLKRQILTLIAVIFLNIVIMGKPYYFSFIVRDAVLITVLFISIKAYLLFINGNKNLPLFIRAFGLSVINAVATAAGVFLLALSVERFDFSYLPRILLINAETAALIGLGLGLGFDAWEYLRQKFLKDKLVKQL